MTKLLYIIFATLFLFIKTNGQTNDSSLQKPKNYYVYNDSLNNSYENFQAGYIDTFSIRKTKFRVLLNKDYLLNLESYQKGKWNIVFSFDYTQYGYYYDKDFDNDGIPDFAIDKKWNNSVHCYNSQTKKFYEDAFDVYEDYSLIDKKKIFSVIAKLTITLTTKFFQTYTLLTMDRKKYYIDWNLKDIITERIIHIFILHLFLNALKLRMTNY